MTEQNTESLSSPFSDPCNCFFLRRAARAASRQYGETMRSTGLQATQFSLLAVLAEIGALSITDLAGKLGLERTSLSRTLKPLVNDGLILVADEGHRRTKKVSLTRAGRRRLKQALPLWREAQMEFTSRLGTKDARTLIGLLKKVADTDNSIAHA